MEFILIYILCALLFKLIRAYNKIKYSTDSKDFYYYLKTKLKLFIEKHLPAAFFRYLRRKALKNKFLGFMVNKILAPKGTMLGKMDNEAPSRKPFVDYFQETKMTEKPFVHLRDEEIEAQKILKEEQKRKKEARRAKRAETEWDKPMDVEDILELMAKEKKVKEAEQIEELLKPKTVEEIEDDDKIIAMRSPKILQANDLKDEKKRSVIFSAFNRLEEPEDENEPDELLEEFDVENPGVTNEMMLEHTVAFRQNMLLLKKMEAEKEDNEDHQEFMQILAKVREESPKRRDVNLLPSS